ncbi:MAG: DUF4352 domain-containing protein [Anaerolineaceae bacterium]|nr:DUF4352 domain-containing protein [Anaerolineaceae bacterium]
MKPKIEDLGEWVTVDDYTVRVESGLKDAVIHDTGVRPPEDVRSVRVLVAYDNPSRQPLKFRLGQWQLVDVEGFAYDAELRDQFYGDDARMKLREGVLDPGQQARGWVAFKVPEKAQPAYIRFRADYVTRNVVNVRVSQLGLERETDGQKPEALRCPGCGAPLPMDGGATTLCAYCGSMVVVPKKLRKGE